jgi:hypothetical protein
MNWLHKLTCGGFESAGDLRQLCVCCSCHVNILNYLLNGTGKSWRDSFKGTQ